MSDKAEFVAIDDLKVLEAWADEMIDKWAHSLRGMDVNKGTGVVYHSLAHSLRCLKGMKRMVVRNRAVERMEL